MFNSVILYVTLFFCITITEGFAVASKILKIQIKHIMAWLCIKTNFTLIKFKC